MHTGLEDRFWNYSRLAKYFSERVENSGPGLIVTGGISPNRSGWIAPFAGTLNSVFDLRNHRKVTQAVHHHDGKICMQILHAGRYGYHPFIVSASAIKAPINKFRPKALSSRAVKSQIKDFVRCASLAQKAGYDGVEIMGSEGYFINQFLSLRTNDRNDAWGGCIENRMKLAVQIVTLTRQAVGEKFIIIFRLSMMDLVDQGSEWSEVVALAKALENAGATIINSGIGWHEARIPTIASSVPAAAFVGSTAKLKAHLTIPVIATNRINTPELAEDILEQNMCDMVSMARPFLADPKFIQKAYKNNADQINTCIACNQACLDQIFNGQKATCMVNPRAVNETKKVYKFANNKKRVAIIGAGPAGLSAATVAAMRGHQVALFEASNQIGGQFNLACKVPGKEDYRHTIRYYQSMLEKYNVTVELNQQLDIDTFNTRDKETGFDEILICTGVMPRQLEIPGIKHEKVLSYLDVLKDDKSVGKKVAIIGAGGIGFDVAAYLLKEDKAEELQDWYGKWGIDYSYSAKGSLVNKQTTTPCREIFLLQRKTTPVGKSLGKTTGWVHRLHLKQNNVKMMNAVNYLFIDDMGLHISIKNEEQCLEVDNVIVCAGQVELRSLYDQIQRASPNKSSHLVGGADLAKELDAQRAIAQGAELAASI